MIFNRIRLHQSNLNSKLIIDCNKYEQERQQMKEDIREAGIHNLNIKTTDIELIKWTLGI